jgi:carbonic anhydrase
MMTGFADADVDLIRNVGTVIDDDAIRSLVVSTRVLGSREIMIINHTGCGMQRIHPRCLRRVERPGGGVLDAAQAAPVRDPVLHPGSGRLPHRGRAND